MIELPPKVDAFVITAQSFVNWCEMDHKGTDTETFRHGCLVRLATLYASALELPDVEFREAPDWPDANEEQRERLTANLLSLPFQYYWEVLDPSDLNNGSEPVCGDLFDDFLDIYEDLAAGLWLLDGGHREAAVFHWRQMFEFHWGRHLVGALHALHLFEPSEAIEA